MSAIPSSVYPFALSGPAATLSPAPDFCGEGEELAPLGACVEARVGTERYELWFARKTRFSHSNGILTIAVSNAFAASWIRSRLLPDVRSAAEEVLGHAVEVQVRVESSLAEAPAPFAEPVMAAYPRLAMPQIGAGAPITGTPLNSRNTFEEFVVGACNQLAYHAASRVAAHPGEQFNPLFLHGHCGLGKTHLLQAICQRFSKLHPTRKWLYLTGEQFTNEFLDALKNHKADAFRRRIRNADLLVIDDVHFLANKKATQEEFLHTFNQLDASPGKQIVLASDCPPRQIQALSEQLASRFISGMVLRVDAPDLPTRLEILRRRAFRSNWQLTDAVLMHVAQSAVSSVRELEGMLLQVVAGMDLINAGRTEPAAIAAAIKDRTQTRGPVPIARIVAAVSEHLHIAPAAIMGDGREKTVSLARSLCFYLARQHTGMSFPEIGRALGNKKHSTAIGACQRVEAWIAAGELVSWQTPDGLRRQAIPDLLHDLDSPLRRGR